MQNLLIHSISGIGRKPVEKIIPNYATLLLTLYDVTNDLIADVQLTGISIGERKHAHRLLSSSALTNNRNYRNLIIFDRGYPSRALIHELEDKGLSFFDSLFPFFSFVRQWMS